MFFRCSKKVTSGILATAEADPLNVMETQKEDILAWYISDHMAGTITTWEYCVQFMLLIKKSTTILKE